MNDSEWSQWMQSLVSQSVRTDLKGLSPKEFERLIAMVLEAHGYLGVTVTGKGGDAGIDGTATTPEGKTLAFQCEHHRSSLRVGPDKVREFESAARAQKADMSLLVTNTEFTSGARALADELGMTLIDGIGLSLMMEERRVFVLQDANNPLIYRLDFDAFRRAVR